MWPWGSDRDSRRDIRKDVRKVRRTINEHAAEDVKRFADLGEDFGKKHEANVARFDGQDAKLNQIATAVSPEVLLPAIAAALRTSRRRAILKYAGVVVATLVAICTIVPALPILWGWQVTIVQAVMNRQSPPPEQPPQRTIHDKDH